MDYSYKFKWLLFAILFAFVSGATAKVVFVGWFEVTPSRSTEVWGYDPANGIEEENIRKNFNLHRGRWWNYYERGSWYLAYGYYRAAESDFKKVIKKRSTDKRDCRTYGMHFRDCFAHRELGITLYYRAIKEKLGKLILLENSIQELETSLKQAMSSRAAFYLNLSKKSLWTAKGEDVNVPVITVKNAIRSGENWAIVFRNPRTVQLDICVTDDQSGVGAIWVNKEKLFVERSAPKISKTLHVPIDTIKTWIVVHAKDLVDNYSPPFLVKVEPDIKTPVTFDTIDPGQTISDGLVIAKYSAHEDLGLSTIQIDDQEIDYNGQREYDTAIQIKAEPSKSSMELRATGLASNTTKSVVNLLSKNNRTKQHVNPSSRLARFTHLNRGRWSTHEWSRPFSAFSRNNTFNLAVRTLSYDMHEIYLGGQVERWTRNEILPFFNYGEKRIEVKALYADRTAVPYAIPSTSQTDQHPIIEPNSVYSVIVLPLIPLRTPGNLSLRSQYRSFWDAVVECKLLDPILGDYYHRFNCRKMQGLDPNTLKTDLSDQQDIRSMVRNLGHNLGVDLGICGFITKVNGRLNIKIYIEDIERNALLAVQDPNNNPIDIYGPIPVQDPKNKPIDIYGLKNDFDPYMELINKLKNSIPRIHGNVKRIWEKNYKIISIDVGTQKGLFLGQKLCIFEGVIDPSAKNLCNRLAQAIVVSPIEGRSVAKTKKSLRGWKKEEIFISTK